MDNMLTFKEKRYIENLMKRSGEPDPVIWPGWGAWVAFVLGGFLIVFVCFITASNMSIENINLVLMPGIFAGMVLLIGGYWAQHMSRKAEADRVLTGILSKLLD